MKMDLGGDFILINLTATKEEITQFIFTDKLQIVVENVMS